MLKKFPRPVVCAWCENRYRSIVPEDICKGTQGDMCASSVYQEGERWYVGSGYGSSYDMSRYQFISNPPTRPADPVCDNCIGERGLDLVEVMETYPNISEQKFRPATGLNAVYRLKDRLEEVQKKHGGLEAEFKAVKANLANGFGTVFQPQFSTATKILVCPRVFRSRSAALSYLDTFGDTLPREDHITGYTINVLELVE
jgi:hypothetical protein